MLLDAMSAADRVTAGPSGEPVPVPLYSCTVSPALALVPARFSVTVRFVSLVLLPLANTPVPGATSSMTAPTVGAPGATVSTVAVNVDDAADVPTVLVALALRATAPSGSEDVVSDHAPVSSLAVMLPTAVVPL